MKNWFLIALILVGCFSYTVLAQPGPGPRPGQEPGFGPGPGQGQGQMQGPNPGSQNQGPDQFQMQPPHPRPMMECGSNGVFILRGGTLLKLDPKTLEKKGEIELKGKQGGRGDDRGYFSDNPPMGPQGPAEMILSGTNLLLVVGEKFVRVDTASFKVKVETELPSPFGNDKPGKGEMRKQGPQEDRMNMPQQSMPMSPMPELKLAGGILYILRGEQILAVNIDSGKVIADNKLMQQRHANQ